MSMHPQIREVEKLPPYGMRVIRYPPPTAIRAGLFIGIPLAQKVLHYRTDTLDVFRLRCPGELRLEGSPIDLNLRAAWDPVDGVLYIERWPWARLDWYVLALHGLVHAVGQR